MYQGDKNIFVIKSRSGVSNEMNWNLHINPTRLNTATTKQIRFHLFFIPPLFSIMSQQSDSWWILNKAVLSLRCSIYYCYVSARSPMLNPMWKTANNNFKSFEVECFSKHRKKSSSDPLIYFRFCPNAINAWCKENLKYTQKQKEKLSKMEMG